MRRTICVLVVCVAALGACGGGEATTDGDRPLTAAEADVLAEVLSRNREVGGASFTLAARRGLDGGTITMAGEVDWVSHEGHAMVAGSTSPHPVTEVWWTETAVYERRPSLDLDLLNADATTTTPVLVRQPDTDRRRLDQLVAVVVGLATLRPENAQLIRQTPGSAMIRTDVLRGRPVTLFRYGERSVYWVDDETLMMLRFEGTDSSGSYPIIVDVLGVGERSITPPSEADVVDFAKVADTDPALSASP